MIENFWNRFLFDSRPRKMPRILLGSFLILVTICAVFICKNAENFIGPVGTPISVNLDGVSADVLAAINPNS